MEKSITICIEQLLDFVLGKGLIEEADMIPARNALYDLLRVPPQQQGEKPPFVPLQGLSPTPVLDEMLDYCAANGLLEEDTPTFRDLFATRIMGALTPRQSQVVNTFEAKYRQSPEEATEYFYELCQSSDYIQTDRIAKNLYWRTDTRYGALEVTVNLSKPEKDPRDIAAARNAPQTNYPLCLLCVENAGFAGHVNHPARQNLRLVPVSLAREAWYMQYSPYLYYNEHCIVLCHEHRPMRITQGTFARLLDFVTYLPHYFVGSNADLPIVGGSILSHDHFQGGRHTFPMETAQTYAAYTHKDFPGLTVGLVDWPMSVLRAAGDDKEELVRFAMYVLDAWKAYSDPAADILAFTGETPHNTITPIARRNQNGQYELDLVLRNNRTTGEHPMGIFHPHAELHHIKKENIGLIEVMGLAILPGRLETEIRQIEEILTGKAAPEIEENSALYQHKDWVKALTAQYGLGRLGAEEARQILRDEIGDKFKQVLEHAGVFKTDETGRAAFARFMEYAGFGL